jgi:hypothetical protein
MNARYFKCVSETVMSLLFLMTLSSFATAENIVWSNLDDAVATGNDLEKVAGCDGCADAGGMSLQKIDAGDGFIEFTVLDNNDLLHAGLSLYNAGNRASSNSRTG